MMKTLLIMRHAKSSWKDAELPDQERPLNKRGKHDAPMMGELIKDKELRPQVIYASTAKRAQMTAEEVSSACKFKGDVTYLENLYLAEAEAILDVLHTTPDEIERVLIIGHNPGLEGLLQMLSHRVESLPTAAIAYLALPISHWADLNDQVEGELVELWKPREMKHKSKK